MPRPHTALVMVDEHLMSSAMRSVLLVLQKLFSSAAASEALRCGCHRCDSADAKPLKLESGSAPTPARDVRAPVEQQSSRRVVIAGAMQSSPAHALDVGCPRRAIPLPADDSPRARVTKLQDLSHSKIGQFPSHTVDAPRASDAAESSASSSPPAHSSRDSPAHPDRDERRSVARRQNDPAARMSKKRTSFSGLSPLSSVPPIRTCVTSCALRGSLDDEISCFPV